MPVIKCVKKTATLEDTNSAAKTHRMLSQPRNNCQLGALKQPSSDAYY